MSGKERLDIALVKRGLAESRERAQAMIMAGGVFINQRRADKPSVGVSDEDAVDVRRAAHPYVSRGGLKLEQAMTSFAVDVRDMVCMDVGASTGGFTDVLLRAGARRVYAIDVGYGQLHWRLRNDPRVTVMERTNARYLTADQFAEKPSLCVMDVSFISVRLLLPVIAAILGREGRILSLIKPQFEAGRENVGKKGVVRDPQVHFAVLKDIAAFAREKNLTVRGIDVSPITGPEGNIEFLYDIVEGFHECAAITDDQIQINILKAHKIDRIG